MISRDSDAFLNSLGEQLLERFEKYCGGFERKEVLRLCDLRPAPTHKERMERNKEELQVIREAAKRLSFELTVEKTTLANWADKGMETALAPRATQKR